MARLLLVEDDASIAASVARGLTAEGHAVDVVHDGETGLERATVGRYDLVVLDIMLPGLNGYRVCAELRAREVWTPVLMLTAKSGDLDEAEGLDTGADDYLTKPFSFPVLVARVRALLRRPGARPQPVEVGTVRVDLAARRAWVGAVELPLTTRELDVLEFLAARRGDVVAKVDLIDALWDAHFEGDHNIVEVYVGRIRRKLAAAGATSIAIETVRGAGYRLVEVP
jgi:DNA-binding response OmpR family regulator